MFNDKLRIIIIVCEPCFTKKAELLIRSNQFLGIIEFFIEEGSQNQKKNQTYNS